MVTSKIKNVTVSSWWSHKWRMSQDCHGDLTNEECPMIFMVNLQIRMSQCPHGDLTDEVIVLRTDVITPELIAVPGQAHALSCRLVRLIRSPLYERKWLHVDVRRPHPLASFGHKTPAGPPAHCSAVICGISNEEKWQMKSKVIVAEEKRFKKNV